MLLRASGERDEQDYDLSAVTSTAGAAGVAQERWLRQLTEQSIGGEWALLRETFAGARQALGLQETVDTLTVAAAFNGITRVADATGIPLDHNTEQTTGEMRASVGIDGFAYAAKSERYPAPTDAAL
jgi:hypothetical protein